LNAKDYGVPQDRQRVFLVGVREDLDCEFHFPTPTHGPQGAHPYATLRDAIWDIQEDPGESFEGHFTSRFMSRQRKRRWDDVGFCVQASAEQNGLHPSGELMRHIGPDLWEFVGDTNRRLSIEECKLIQSFRRDFQLVGTLKSRYKQVGNAVPPLLAKVMAGAILQNLRPRAENAEFLAPALSGQKDFS
jgi:DNA (cytosine-5)-methyltransferase 1